MAKDDKVTIMTKGGAPLTVISDKGGRKIEHDWDTRKAGPWFVARLLTRGGTEIKRLEVPATEIVSIEIQVKEIE